MLVIVIIAWASIIKRIHGGAAESLQSIPSRVLSSISWSLWDLCLYYSHKRMSRLAAENFKITFPGVLPTTAFIHHSQPVVWTVTVPTNLVRAFLSAESTYAKKSPRLCLLLFFWTIFNLFSWSSQQLEQTSFFCRTSRPSSHAQIK